MFDGAISVTLDPQVMGNVVVGIMAGLVPLRLFGWGLDRLRQIVGWV